VTRGPSRNRPAARNSPFTNHITLEGRLPQDRERLLDRIHRALALGLSAFRDVYVGTA
jgi:hypothetical protein